MCLCINLLHILDCKHVCFPQIVSKIVACNCFLLKKLSCIKWYFEAFHLLKKKTQQYFPTWEYCKERKIFSKLWFHRFHKYFIFSQCQKIVEKDQLIFSLLKTQFRLDNHLLNYEHAFVKMKNLSVMTISKRK